MPSKILVVDDEVDIARAWERTLRIAGYNVAVTHDPATARKLCRENPFDLVILDYMMPTMSGIELLNEIRRDLPTVRSIIVSGKIDSSVSESSVLSEIRANIEADVYLHKPVDNARLKEAVSGLLSTSTTSDWKAYADMKLDAPKAKKTVRTAEKALNKKKARRKK